MSVSGVRCQVSGKKNKKAEKLQTRLRKDALILALVCNQLPVTCLCSLTYLRERLEAFKGLSFTTFSVPDLMWVARLQEPFFHLIWGSGQDWQ
jgi:hypothetical protein